MGNGEYIKDRSGKQSSGHKELAATGTRLPSLLVSHGMNGIREGDRQRRRMKEVLPLSLALGRLRARLSWPAKVGK